MAGFHSTFLIIGYWGSSGDGGILGYGGCNVRRVCSSGMFIPEARLSFARLSETAVKKQKGEDDQSLNTNGHEL